ncbi:lamin tail domain-containing protein, partial [Planctomycetota bacterium]
EYGGSPGKAGAGPLGDVVINELLTHTDLPDVDTIELANRTEETIDLGGWYVTDSVANPFRYKIPANTEIDPGEYLSFDEVTLGFSFRGQESDNAFVIEPDATGKPLRFVDGVSYSATQNGVTLGRWEDGIGELFPMTERTFDDENSGPLIGDIVISEVHYNPAAPVGVAADDLEFVELTNSSGVPLDLSQWQLAKSVDFTIPTGFIMPADSSIIIVGFDPANDAKIDQFEKAYLIPDDAMILGPYSDATDPNADQLDDDGERLILQRPEDIFQLGLGYVLVDRVIYSDSGDWPAEADGRGRSLTRNNLSAYGDFASTWSAAIPTPGSLGTVGDVNGDQIVDALDIDQLCVAINFGGNPTFDLNSDGEVNAADLSFLIETVLESEIGDSNLDGSFNSGDFVTVFRAGEYEDAIARNSGWAEGDWNCDGDFTSSDLVTAFTAGTYSENAIARPRTLQTRTLAAAIIEDRPSSDPAASSAQAAPIPPELNDANVKILAPDAVEFIFAEQRLPNATPTDVDQLDDATLDDALFKKAAISA